MMLPSDFALIEDENMLPWVQLYATDQARFFQDFSAAFTKLQELGVAAFHHSSLDTKRMFFEAAQARKEAAAQAEKKEL